mgnify:CR=1 FL=1|tara:strand:- start:247 stop:717 length:471 start_codon:yes stop_codon:yes gene_type:complete
MHLQFMKSKIMKSMKSAIPVVAVSFMNAPVVSVPLVPNFQTGSLTSHTETTSTVTETINVIDYQTGWQYTVTGNNISTDANSLVPPAQNVTQSVNGVNSTWTNLDTTNMPNFTVTDSSKPWQLTTTLSQPGLKTQTIIQRTTEINSVTDTVSTFSQ